MKPTMRWPGLSFTLGDQVRRHGNVPILASDNTRQICTFPTKNHWKDRSSILLIEKSAGHLLQIIGNNPGYNWILPRPGCGNGKLQWEKVKPVIEFLPDNVWVIWRNAL